MTITYPKAFNTEINDILTPDEAHDYSLQNKLTKPRNFQCGINCDFQLTLTNFAKKDYVQSPHFTPGKRNQVHSSSCDLMIHRKEQRKLDSMETNKVFYRDKSNIKVDMDFTTGLLSKIASGTHQNTSDYLENDGIAKPTKLNKKSKNISKASTSTILKSLKKLIDYYHDFKQGELLTFTDMSDNPLNLDKIFTELSPNLDITDYSPKIYFGMATVRFVEDVERPYFIISYKNKISFAGVLGSPSKIINEAAANVQGSKTKVNHLKRLAKSREEFMLYYFGGFKLNQSNGRGYINFDKEYGEEIKYIFIP